MSDTVALIGVGAMGKALLSRLRIANKKVRAYDISEAGREAARANGADVVGSAAEAAKGAAYIHIFVRTDDQMIDATMGPNGVLATAAPGSLLILHPTVLPKTTLRVGEAAKAKRVRVLDIPITSVPAKVQAGEAAFLVGGEKDVADAARPYMLELGASFYHFGPLGCGNVAKLAKNYANAASRIVLDDSLRLVESIGIDPKQFLDMVRDMDQGSLVATWEKTFNIANGHASHRPATNLFNKDLVLAAEYAESAGLDLPVAKGAAVTGLKWAALWERQKAARPASS